MSGKEGKIRAPQQIIEAIQADITGWAARMDALSRGFRPPGALLSSIDALAHGMRQAVPKILPILEEVGRMAVALSEVRRREALLEESGWLPHRALPLARLADHTSGVEVDADFVAHLHSQWSEVRDGMRERLRGMNINESSKEVFIDALRAHEVGLYRCVCRTLMPEIERAVRIDLNGGSLAYPKEPRERSSATKLLRATAGELPISVAGPGGWLTAILFKKLSEHLYERIDDNLEKLADFEHDPVPNRNATVHGLIDYSTFKHSINAIFMTDYTFQVISAAKS